MMLVVGDSYTVAAALIVRFVDCVVGDSDVFGIPVARVSNVGL